MLALSGSAGGATEPRIVVPQEVPPAVTELVNSTWQSFLATFPAQRDCIGTVELVLVDEVVGGDASYSRDGHVIKIQIPTTPARFPESLAHELGHHLERACPVIKDIGRDFERAQDFDLATTDWYLGEFWYKRPTEQFAETVVQLLLGERILHSDIIVLSEEAVHLVAEWGRG